MHQQLGSEKGKMVRQKLKVTPTIFVCTLPYSGTSRMASQSSVTSALVTYQAHGTILTPTYLLSEVSVLPCAYNKYKKHEKTNDNKNRDKRFLGAVF